MLAQQADFPNDIMIDKEKNSNVFIPLVSIDKDPSNSVNSLFYSPNIDRGNPFDIKKII